MLIIHSTPFVRSRSILTHSTLPRLHDGKKSERDRANNEPTHLSLLTFISRGLCIVRNGWDYQKNNNEMVNAVRGIEFDIARIATDIFLSLASSLII